MKNTSWFGKQRASVQVAVVGGLLAVLGGVLTGAAQIISAEIGKPIAIEFGDAVTRCRITIAFIEPSACISGHRSVRNNRAWSAV
jgi:hypothetical protein